MIFHKRALHSRTRAALCGQSLLLASALLVSCTTSMKQQQIDMAGTWQFTTDSTTWNGTIKLPGSMTSNGLGDDISVNTPWVGQVVDNSYFTSDAYAQYRKPGNIKIPFWLQPVKYYKGVAWYKRTVDIPKDWKKQDISLFLERCHWESRLYIDGHEVGMRNSLGTPHRYDLSDILTPGRHQLGLRIDNQVKDIDPGLNSHSISDHTQGNWNGIVGDMYLEVRPQVNVVCTAIYPDIHNKSIRVVSNIRNRKSTVAQAILTLEANGKKLSRNIVLAPGTNEVEETLLLGNDARLWDEFTPNLYNLTVSIADKKGKTTDTHIEQFGLREIKVADGRLTVNSHPAFMRGTLDCAAFPKTGFPPTDKASWRKIFAACKAHGMNHVRYHSWCPPEAAFAAADEMGMYLEVECSGWVNTTVTLGDGLPIDKYIMDESEAMVKGYVSPEEYRQFCSPTVPLVRLPKLIYTTDEVLKASAEVAHYGAAPLKNIDAGWTLTDSEGSIIQSGKWHLADIPLGNKLALGDISARLGSIVTPQCLTLEVAVGNARNKWNVWVYPSKIEQSAAEKSIRMVDSLDVHTLKALNDGHTVLLSLRKGTLSKDMGGNIEIGFSSIFWNTAWTNKQAPHTLGILCNPKHPALGEFPTTYHSDYQWWDAMSHSGAIEFAKISPDIEPVVRVIDDWFTNRPLALVFEVRVGQGRLLVSGIDFWQDMDNRPEARQLLHSLKKYMSSPAFRPSVIVAAEQLQKLWMHP